MYCTHRRWKLDFHIKPEMLSESTLCILGDPEFVLKMMLPRMMPHWLPLLVSDHNERACFERELTCWSCWNVRKQNLTFMIPTYTWLERDMWFKFSYFDTKVLYFQRKQWVWVPEPRIEQWAMMIHDKICFTIHNCSDRVITISLIMLIHMQTLLWLILAISSISQLRVLCTFLLRWIVN